MVKYNAMKFEKSEYFVQNELKLNRVVAKSFALITLVPYIVLLMVHIGLFNFSIVLASFGAVFSTILSLIFYIISKKEINSKSFKYFLCISLQAIILIYSADCDMDITVFYMLSPIVALLYFNPRLEIITCILSIISMMIGIIIQAPVTVKELYHDVTPFMFVLTTGGAHCMEMIATSGLLFVICIHSRRLINTVHKRNEEIALIQNNLAYSFADMIESRDGTTGEHVKRTSKIVALLVEKIAKNPDLYDEILSSRELQLIAMSAPLHDIGKLKVPDIILSKPGKLTPEEFDIIKTHSAEGAKIINKTMASIEDPVYVGIAHDMALYHHEKWNGSGYPNGLSGKTIPACARIMAVADVFDALCSKRSYKKPMSIDEAFVIMNESKGSHFEPILVEILNQLRSEMEEIYS